MTVTSAGVFNSDGKLVRTLWSAKTNYPAAADAMGAWDGTLDDMSVAPSGAYTVKLLTSNAQYTWEGAVGNNSPDHTNLAYHNHFTGMTFMDITDDGHIFFTHNYDERWRVIHRSTTADPYHQEYCVDMTFRATNNPTFFCSTDSINVYFCQSFSTFHYVYALACSNIHTVLTFPFGAAGNLSAIDQVNDANGVITGMAVQKTGSYFFTSRNGLSSIHTSNKTTGQFIANYAGITSPGQISVNPLSSTEIWVATSANAGVTWTSVSKMNVSVGGVLTTAGVTITGLQDIQSMDISPDGTLLLLVDGKTSQQVKAYNTSTGAVRSAWGSSGTLGLLGGYANGPDVTNTKFMFDPTTSTANVGRGYVAFQPDGSFWLGDAGNFRNIHFSSGNSPTFIKQVSWIGGFYSTRLCINDDTRYFIGWLEYHIDYSISFGLDNGSWTLVKNWAYGTPESDQYDAMKFVGTYSNGRTYAGVLQAGVRHIWEATAAGWRDTGKTISNNNNVQVDTGFNLWSMDNIPGGGSPANIYKNPFTGFDGSANPTWLYNSTIIPNVVYMTTEVLPAAFPPLSPGAVAMSTRGPWRLLSNGTFPVYNDDSYAYLPDGNHVGLIEASTGKIKAMSHHLTNSNQSGVNTITLQMNNFRNFPETPYFPYIFGGPYGGGHLQYKAGTSDFFTCYRGENWGNNQTNIWLHWHESGLVAGQFGVAAPYFGMKSLLYPNINIANPNAGPGSDATGQPSGSYIYDLNPTVNRSFKGMIGLAGNSAWGDLAFENGKYYIYQNDEWYHGGASRWRVDNLNTVQLSTVGTVNWDSFSYQAPPPTDPFDLLHGLPYNSIDVPNGAAGWHRSMMNFGTPQHAVQSLRISTNFFKSDAHGNHGLMTDKSPDLCFNALYAGVITLYKDFEVATIGNWVIDSTIFFTSPSAGVLTRQSIVAEVLDAAGLVLFRIHPFDPIGVKKIVGNGVPFGTPSTDPNVAFWDAYIAAERPLVITANVSGNTMHVVYGDFSLDLTPLDPLANIANPKRIRIVQDGSEFITEDDLGMGFTKLKFLPTLPIPPEPPTPPPPPPERGRYRPAGRPKPWLGHGWD